MFFSLLFQQVSGAAKVAPPTGTSTAGRGRRQLPQTPLTPRPGVAYKTASSSALPGSAVASGHQARLSRGLSEHDRHPVGHSEGLLSITCMGSDPNLNRQHLDSSRQALLGESEDFQDALSSHGGGRFANTAASSTTSQRGAAEAATATTMQGRAAGVPNGYHFTLGVNAASGSGNRGTGNLREREKDDWCWNLWSVWVSAGHGYIWVLFCPDVGSIQQEQREAAGLNLERGVRKKKVREKWCERIEINICTEIPAHERFCHS